mgnify:CR=1 FL=1
MSRGANASREDVASPSFREPLLLFSSQEEEEQHSQQQETPSLSRNRLSRKRLLFEGVSIGADGEVNFTNSETIRNSMSPQEHQKFLAAATYLEDAKYYRTEYHKRDSRSIRWYRIFHKRYIQVIFSLTTILYMAIGCFERPALYEIADWSSALLDLIFLLILIFRLCIIFMYTGLQKFVRSGWNVTNTTLLGVSILSLIVSWGLTGRTFLWFRMFRAFFLVESSQVTRKLVVNILRTIPGILDVLACVFCVHLIYTVFCMLLFFQTTEGCLNFSGFWNSWFNLLVTLTTANFPDIMMPAYAENGLYSLVFITFLIICLYLLMSLVLAVVYKKYSDELKVDVRRALWVRLKSLSRCFDLIADRGGQELRPVSAADTAKFPSSNTLLLPGDETQFGPTVSSESSSETEMAGSFDEKQDMGKLQSSSEIHGRFVSVESFCKLLAVMRPWYPVEKMDTLFEAVNVSQHEEGISSADFVGIVDALNVRILSSLETKTLFERMCPGIYNTNANQKFCRFINSRAFDVIVDCVLLSYCIFLIIVAEQMTNDRAYNCDLQTPPVYIANTVFEWMFTALYMLEIFLRIYALGFVKCWKNLWFRADVVILSALIISTIVQLSGVTASSVTKSVQIIRSIRLFRLFFHVKRFYHIIGTLLSLLGSLVSYLIVMMALYYIFAIMGQGLFAGLIFEGNPALEGTPFAASQYFPNNFNNLPAAFVTLFELMVVNNWQVIVSGYTAVRGSGARVFFIFFWLLSVAVVVNIVVAFVLDAFVSKYDKQMEEADKYSNPVAKRIASSYENAHEDEILRSSYGLKDSQGRQRDKKLVFTVTQKKPKTMDLLIETIGDDLEVKVVPVSELNRLKKELVSDFKTSM